MAGNEESYRKLVCFNCYDKSLDFNVDSFLRTGEIPYVFKRVRDLSGGGNVMLFERKFDQGSAIHHIKVLFRLARKELKMLENFVNQYEDQIFGNTTEAECAEIRRHILELLNYIRVYFLSLPMEMKGVYYRWKMDVLEEISFFYKSLPALSFYSDMFVQLFSRKDSYCIYHMYHLILDVHWYYISLLVILKNYADSLNDPNEGAFPFENDRVKERGSLEKLIQSLLSELISIAIIRQEKIKSGDPYEETPYACKCMEEIWVLLQFLGDSLADARAGKSFWSQVNLLLDKVSLGNSMIQNESNLDGTRAAKCSDPTAFSLWLILHLSNLYGYNELGEFVGKKSGRAKNNHSQLEKSLLLFINQNSLPGSEPKIELLMRSYICISSIICLERWWKPMGSEVVMIFWEYFHSRLNKTLLLPGSSPASHQLISKSALGMLSRVEGRITKESAETEEDSFFVFLKFLARYLTHCRKEGAPESRFFRQWHQIKGRLYSKLSPTKVKGLSHLGLHRLVHLFLTLSIVVDIKEVGKKMLDTLYLFAPWDPSGRDMAKRELAMQGHLCLLSLHVQHEIDVANIAKPLIVEVNAACNELSSVSKLNGDTVFHESWISATAHSEGLRRLLSSFVQGVDEIISSSLRLCSSEHTLIGPWILNCLKICSPASSRRLMDIILSILKKLHTLRDSVLQVNVSACYLWDGSALTEGNEDVEGSLHMKEQWKKMETALVENVLPTVQSLSLDSDPPFQIADIAAYFTLASFSSCSENFTQLFNYFASSDNINYRVSRRYLSNLLNNEKFMKALSIHLRDYQDIIIQVWVRCSLLSSDVSNQGEIEELTHTVVKLQKVSRILSMKSNSSDIKARKIDSFEDFLILIAEKYDSYHPLLEKSKFREQCLVYFSKVDRIIAPHIRAPTSQAVVISIYHVCGLMVLHCGNIIYSKGIPNCALASIISHLILPACIYNPKSKINKFILNACRKSLIMFAHGLAKLSPNTDPYIKRCLKDMITHYLPRLHEKNQTSSPSLHPLLVSFEKNSPESEIVQSFILDILSSVFLTSKEKLPHTHASKAVDMLEEILESGRKKSKAFEDGRELLKQIATCSLPRLLEFLSGVDESLEEWNKALNFINKIYFCLEEACGSLNSINEIIEGTEGYGIPSDVVGHGSQRKESWKDVFSLATKKFFEQYVAFSASAVFRVMYCLVRSNTQIVKASIGDLEEEVKKVELKRGVGYDPVLRNYLGRLRASLEAAMKTN